MKYYQSGDLILSHLTESNLVLIKNKIGAKRISIPLDEFNTMPKTELTMERYNELLNDYFRNNREEWVYENKVYCSMQNFETDKNGKVLNYEMSKIPVHRLSNENFVGNVIQVYHRKRQYYMQWGEDNDRCRLIDTYDFTPLKWVRAKNCSPIMCKTDRTII